MKELVRWLVVLLIILPACERTEVIPLPGSTVSGQIYTLDEFGEAISDKAGATVTVRGTSPLLSGVTDAEGNFEISDVPAGTYNLEITKEGYGTIQLQGVSVLGATELRVGTIRIARKSTITIENLTLETQGSYVYLRCKVNHNFVSSTDLYARPDLYYVIGDSEDVSDTNFRTSGLLPVEVASGSELLCSIYLNRALYPSGSRIYLRAYGFPKIGYFDILSGLYIYTGLGEPSNVATIIVP